MSTTEFQRFEQKLLSNQVYKLSIFYCKKVTFLQEEQIYWKNH